MSIPGLTLNALEGVGLAIQQANNPSVKRSIGGLTPQITIEERNHDRLTITQHPVEQGAAITDHAYKEPASVIIECAWSYSATPSNNIMDIPSNIVSGLLATGSLFNMTPQTLTNIYDSLLATQANAVLITIVTGKRTYANMLLTTIDLTTNKDSENALLLRVEAQQVILVSTSSSPVPPYANQAFPNKTAATVPNGTKQLGPAPLYSVPNIPGLPAIGTP